MRQIIKIFYLNILILSFLSLSGCWTEKHLLQAIKYSEASVIADDGAAIAKHSTTARIHALLVQNQNYISSAEGIHLAIAIISLEQAIEHGKHEAHDSARKSARIAAAHFKEITKY